MDVPKIENLNSSNCTERSIFLHYFEFWRYLNDNFPKELKWTEKLYWYYNGLTEYPKCKMCDNPTKFVNFKTGYREFCSYKCMNSCQSIQERKKKTCMKHYGCDNPMHSEICKEKLKQTNINKFGVDNVFKSSVIKEKIQETSLEKYGCVHHMKNFECVSKMLKTRNNITISRNPDILDIMDNFIYKMKCPHIECTKCSEKWYEIPNPNLNDRMRLHSELCTRLSPIGKYTNGTSLELFIRGILDKYDIKYETNVRNIIPPQELDIYIPDRHIAIECNGTYFHSAELKSRNYHKDKFIKCLEQGIQLITIWEDWIINKPRIVEAIILSKLGIYKERIYARQCQIREISSKESNQLLERNHIQGKCSAHVRYGLYFKDQLVATMTFGKNRNMVAGGTKNNWELVRFCCGENMQIIGGANKMMSHFIKDYNPETIYSFSSNDISNGNLYEKLGFTKATINLSYWYISSKDNTRWHRSAFTKNAIVKRGWKNDKSGWKETDVMKEHGYCQIYDSGQTKWIYKNPGQ